MASTRRPPARHPVPARQIEAVLRASRALVGIAAASIAEVDGEVTVPQLRVLVILDTRGPQNLAAVAAALEVNASNASRTCDRLLKAGLLDRNESPKDRRNVVLTLTPAGKSLAGKVAAHRRSAIGRVLRKMNAADREALTAACDSFASAAGEPREDDTVVLI